MNVQFHVSSPLYFYKIKPQIADSLDNANCLQVWFPEKINLYKYVEFVSSDILIALI